MISKRVFFISSRPYQGFVGGASGVNYRLFFYEKEFNIFKDRIKDFVYIFSDKVINKSDLEINEIENSKTIQQNSIKKAFKKYVLKIIKSNNLLYSFYLFNLYKKNVNSSLVYFEKLNIKYSFSENDIFIMQDTETANALRSFISGNNLIVYHSQGSLVNEFESIYDIKLHKRFKSYLNNIQKRVFEYYDNLGFPSKGSYETIRNQLPQVDFGHKKIEVLYNTFNSAEYNEKEKNNFINAFEYKEELQKNVLKLISVSTITHLKGLDQTINVLGELKKRGLEFIWFMIGNGEEKYIKDVILPLINKNNLEENIIQIRSLPNFHVNILLSLTDFYIMMHRFSIFDIATLEAMNNYNIPILSNVGGNKEYNISGNAFLYNNNIDDLYDYINRLNISDTKEENKRIAKTIFDSKSFLNRYLKFIEKLK